MKDEVRDVSWEVKKKGEIEGKKAMLQLATLTWLKAKKSISKNMKLERKWERLTWVEARKQSVLGSTSGRSHLEDTDQSQSQLQGIKGDEEGRFQGKLKDESIS